MSKLPLIFEPYIANVLVNFERYPLADVHTNLVTLILAMYIRQLAQAKTIQSSRIHKSINGDFAVLALDAECLADLEK